MPTHQHSSSQSTGQYVTYTYTPENHPCTVYLATRLWHDVFGKRREWDEQTVGDEVGRLGEFVSAFLPGGKTTVKEVQSILHGEAYTPLKPSDIGDRLDPVIHKGSDLPLNQYAFRHVLSLVKPLGESLDSHITSSGGSSEGKDVWAKFADGSGRPEGWDDLLEVTLTSAAASRDRIGSLARILQAETAHRSVSIECLQHLLDERTHKLCRVNTEAVESQAEAVEASTESIRDAETGTVGRDGPDEAPQSGRTQASSAAPSKPETEGPPSLPAGEFDASGAEVAAQEGGGEDWVVV